MYIIKFFLKYKDIKIIRDYGDDPFALLTKSISNSLRRKFRFKSKLEYSLGAVYPMWASRQCAYSQRQNIKLASRIWICLVQE